MNACLGNSGWWRVFLQGSRMPDYEIVMRMVLHRKQLEHMFAAPRGGPGRARSASASGAISFGVGFLRKGHAIRAAFIDFPPLVPGIRVGGELSGV